MCAWKAFGGTETIGLLQSTLQLLKFNMTKPTVFETRKKILVGIN